jgi:hypothetical protein
MKKDINIKRMYNKDMWINKFLNKGKQLIPMGIEVRNRNK